MKTCKLCHINQELSMFYKHKKTKDRLQTYCKACQKTIKNMWNTNNKHAINEKLKQQYQKNKEQYSKKSQKHYQNNLSYYKEYNKQYYKETKETRKTYNNLYRKNKYETDVQFRLRSVLRSRLKNAIQFKPKSGSAVKDLGCSIIELIEYLESKFTSKMSWENYGKYWQIDHIKPLFKFNLENMEEFKEACHYSNLQPLSIEDHIVKTTEDRRR